MLHTLSHILCKVKSYSNKAQKNIMMSNKGVNRITINPMRTNRTTKIATAIEAIRIVETQLTINAQNPQIHSTKYTMSFIISPK